MTATAPGNPFAPAAVAELAAMDFDIIHTHCPIVSTLLARSLREAIDKPVVFTYHTKFDIDIAKAVRGKTLQDAAVKLLVSNISACDEVWVVSRGAEKISALSDTRATTSSCRTASISRASRHPPEAVDALSRKWALPPISRYTCSSGASCGTRGCASFSTGSKKVRDGGGDFCMVFVGDGQDTAPPWRNTPRSSVTDLCRFTGTERDRDTIRAWYTRADLLLFPRPLTRTVLSCARRRRARSAACSSRAAAPPRASPTATPASSFPKTATVSPRRAARGRGSRVFRPHRRDGLREDLSLVGRQREERPRAVPQRDRALE